jgi:uncharacterized protein DUF5063
VTASPGAWWESPAVPPFRAVSARFIKIIRDRDTYSASDLLHRIHPLLAELYVAGFALPVKPESAYGEDADDDVDLPVSDPAVREQRHARWRSIYIALGKQIGTRWNNYQEVFDPYADPAETPVTGSLADDLADIFLDLEDGDELWAGGAFDAAVWEWRFGFESHWGEHITGALRAIRTLAAVHDLGFPSP